VKVLRLTDPEKWKKATARLYDEYVKEHPEAGPMINKFNDLR